MVKCTKGVEFVENLSTVLKKRRKELGVTFLQIADEMNVSEATVQRWESGNIKMLRHERIAKLAFFDGVGNRRFSRQHRPPP